jgi:hypothetical protein
MSDYPAASDAPRFSDIQAILNSLIQGHVLQHLKDIHNEPNFGWGTLDQLKSVVIHPDGQFGDAYPLIDMALVEAGRGDETNLVIALRDPGGVNSYGRMPYEPPPGRYASPAEISTIVAWLNAGMPE